MSAEDKDPCANPACPRDDVLDGDDPGAHWATAGSDVIAAWSCSEACSRAVEALRVDGRLPVPDPEWDGFESRRDMVAAMIYNAHAQSPREMTPERWWEVKRRFGATARMCLEQAEAALQDM